MVCSLSGSALRVYVNSKIPGSDCSNVGDKGALTRSIEGLVETNLERLRRTYQPVATTLVKAIRFGANFLGRLTVGSLEELMNTAVEVAKQPGDIVVASLKAKSKQGRPAILKNCFVWFDERSQTLRLIQRGDKKGNGSYKIVYIGNEIRGAGDASNNSFALFFCNQTEGAKISKENQDINTEELNVLMRINSCPGGRDILPEMFWVQHGYAKVKYGKDSMGRPQLKPFMIQELFWEDLFTFINRRVSGAQEGELEIRFDVAIQILGMLEILQRLEMVHGDIKTPNFLIKMVDGKPVVKMIDLGLAFDLNDLKRKSIRPINKMDPALAVIALGLKEINSAIDLVTNNLEIQKGNLRRQEEILQENPEDESLLSKAQHFRSEICWLERYLSKKILDKKILLQAFREKIGSQYDVFRTGHVFFFLFQPVLDGKFISFYKSHFETEQAERKQFGFHKASAIKMAGLLNPEKIREYERFDPGADPIAKIIYGMLHPDPEKRWTSDQVLVSLNALKAQYFQADVEGSEEEDLGGAGAAGIDSDGEEE